MERAYSPPGSFGRGLQRYIESDAFANSVPEDLWGGLATAAGDEALAAQLTTWSANPGYPLITAVTTPAGALVLQQQPYDPAADPQMLWAVPAVAVVPTSRAEPAETLLVLDRVGQLTTTATALPSLGGAPLFLLKPVRRSWLVLFSPQPFQHMPSRMR